MKTKIRNLVILGRFRPIFVNFCHFLTIFSNFRNFAIICNFQNFFAIFYHFLPFFALFGEYAFECIVNHLNPFLDVSAHCINFFRYSFKPEKRRNLLLFLIWPFFCRFWLVFGIFFTFLSICVNCSHF